MSMSNEWNSGQERRETPHLILATGRAAANRERAEWLYALHQSELGISVADMIREAVTTDALRRISLWQALISLPGWGDARATRVIQHMHAAHGSTQAERQRRIHIGTIVDGRRGGRLWIALADALARETRRDDLIPAGFPYADVQLGPTPTLQNAGAGVAEARSAAPTPPPWQQ